jgi:ferritin-like metal-binding protein YciE
MSCRRCEVTHYELLSAMAKEIKNRRFATHVKAILAEEKRHLQLCTRLAKEIAAALLLSITKDMASKDVR